MDKLQNITICSNTVLYTVHYSLQYTPIKTTIHTKNTLTQFLDFQGIERFFVLEE